jgi:hypothetical protein
MDSATPNLVLYQQKPTTPPAHLTSSIPIRAVSRPVHPLCCRALALIDALGSQVRFARHDIAPGLIRMVHHRHYMMPFISTIATLHSRRRIRMIHVTSGKMDWPVSQAQTTKRYKMAQRALDLISQTLQPACSVHPFKNPPHRRPTAMSTTRIARRRLASGSKRPTQAR